MKNNNSVSVLGAFRQKASQIKTNQWRQLQQRIHHTSGHSRPAFLVGCGRSGTSMLVLQLGRSWQIDVYNENNPAAFENWFLRDTDIINQLIAKSAAPIVLFKPILETYRTDVLLDGFPEARVMFAFRHYDDVINSSLKKFGTYNRVNHVNAWVKDNFDEFADFPPPPETQEKIRSLWRPDLSPEEGAALYWVFHNHLFFDLGLANSDQSCLVEYEAVVSNPELGFNQLCEFLGVRFESRMAEGIFDSSIQKNPSPTLNPLIQTECDQLWQRLSDHAARQ